ncbi:MAG TPA: peptide chain release factor 1 [Patescibacteria group bacterium]|nr:peptide chain release factor 1 [Patescibacteria group bacterium]
MQDQIDKIKKEYAEITLQISNPKNTTNIPKLQELSRKKAELERIILDFDKLEKIKKEILENEELVKNEDEPELKKLIEEDLTRLKIEKENLEKFVKIALSPEAAQENKNVILEIRPGTGGDEAELFAADLLKMYLKFAEKKGWRVEILNSQKTTLDGIKDVTCLISGHEVFRFLKFESGVHRVQRVPKTEKSGRIHTSTATVAILPEATETEVKINPAEIKIDTFRSSGPGGQGVNTTDSAVRLTHLPTGTVVSCQDERSQMKNKEKAFKILRAKLLDLQFEKEQGKMAEERKSQVGRADRSEKIRTYNFPQDRITDHRGGFSVKNIERILNGDLDILINKLLALK